ncbi:MAG: plastocyanin/azurin family copper-binding protein [Solirubrobacterales bacterium]
MKHTMNPGRSGGGSKATVGIALLGIAPLLLGGCGGGGGTETTTAAPARKLTISMGEFYFKPANAVAGAGRVTIAAPNRGAVAHELVLARTDLPASKLPTLPNGEVNEEKFEKSGHAPGEIADVKPGESKTGTFDLPSGRYVMYCNLPGHYKAGMYGTIVVK